MAAMRGQMRESIVSGVTNSRPHAGLAAQDVPALLRGERAVGGDRIVQVVVGDGIEQVQVVAVGQDARRSPGFAASASAFGPRQDWTTMFFGRSGLRISSQPTMRLPWRVKISFTRLLK